MTIQLIEAIDTTLPDAGAATRPDGSRRFRSKIIREGWGSSCYYPGDVIQRDGPALFGPGTQMYFDHPSESEQWQRPERSIRDLGGRIDSVPVWEAAGLEGPGLYADVLVFPHQVPVIEALWRDIGLSVIAAAEVTTGERDGRAGRIATRLVPGERGTSVDFVTRAGAGGALVSVMESARAAAAVAADPIAEALPGDLTGNQLRDALRQLVRDAWTDRDGYASLRDFTDDAVIFEVYWRGSDHLYQQAYTASDGDASVLALTGEPTEVRAVTTYVPVPPSETTAPPTTVPVAGAAITESSGGPPVARTEIDDAELAQLREAAANRTTIAAVEAERDTARAELAAVRAVTAARPVVVAAVAESTLIPAASQAVLVESVLQRVPLTEAGAVDTTALTALVETERTAKETEITAVLEAHGITGRPAGVGPGTTPGATGAGAGTEQVAVTESNYRDRVLAARGRKTTATTTGTGA